MSNFSNVLNQKDNEDISLYVTLLIISGAVLIFGVLGITEHKSPKNLNSLTSLISSVITYIEYHVMIVFGALGVTLSIWTIHKRKN